MSEEKSPANPELDNVIVVVDTSPKKRKHEAKLEAKPEYDAHHIQSKFALIMTEPSENPPQKKFRTQKLPVAFYDDNTIQIALSLNKLRLNSFNVNIDAYDSHDINLASFLIAHWPDMNQVKSTSIISLDNILKRLIFLMKAGLVKIDMNMVDGQLWATIWINNKYEFTWDVTDHFLVLCQMEDGTLKFYSFLHLKYIENTPYSTIDISKYTPSVTKPIHSFMDAVLPKL
jgi:hypothetical protein